MTKRRTANEMKRDIIMFAEDLAAAAARMTKAENELHEAKLDRQMKKCQLENLAREIEQRLLEVPKPAEDRPETAPPAREAKDGR